MPLDDQAYEVARRADALGVAIGMHPVSESRHTGEPAWLWWVEALGIPGVQLAGEAASIGEMLDQMGAQLTIVETYRGSSG